VRFLAVAYLEQKVVPVGVVPVVPGVPVVGEEVVDPGGGGW